MPTTTGMSLWPIKSIFCYLYGETFPYRYDASRSIAEFIVYILMEIFEYGIVEISKLFTLVQMTLYDWFDSWLSSLSCIIQIDLSPDTQNLFLRQDIYMTCFFCLECPVRSHLILNVNSSKRSYPTTTKVQEITQVTSLCFNSVYGTYCNPAFPVYMFIISLTSGL